MLSAEKMQFLRRLSNVTQTEVAKELNCTKNLISMIENRKQNCSEEWQKKYIDAIYKIAEQKKNKDVFKETKELKEEIEKIKKTKTNKK